MTGLRWSRRTTTTIAEELAQLGIAVSPNTVARLLHEMEVLNVLIQPINGHLLLRSP